MLILQRCFRRNEVEMVKGFLFAFVDDRVNLDECGQG